MTSPEFGRIHDLKRKVKILNAELSRLASVTGGAEPKLIEICSTAKWVESELTDLFPEPESPQGVAFESGVLIEDSALVAAEWQMLGQQFGKTVDHYATGDLFLKNSIKYDRSTYIYIDWFISPFTDSLDLTQEVHRLGFTNIFITTHYVGLNLDTMPWVKAIIGKDPPWTQ